MLGPLGNSFTIPSRAQRLLMIGGGVGVAPLVMLSDEAAARNLDVVFVMGAANEAGLLAASELSDRIEYVVATDDGSRGHRGLATEVVGDYVQWADQIYACGPEPMYRTLRAVVDPLRINRQTERADLGGARDGLRARSVPRLRGGNHSRDDRLMRPGPGLRSRRGDPVSGCRGACLDEDAP